MTKNKGTKDKDINELSNHKPRRGRPIGAKNQKKKSTPQPVSIIDKSQDIMEIIDVTPQNYNLKGEMTERELKFVQWGYSIDSSSPKM